MILRSRRLRAIYISLSAMDIAVLLPFVLTWIARGLRWNEFALPGGARSALNSPISLFVAGWIIMLLYMAVVDFLDQRRLASQRRELIILVLVVATSLIGVRLTLYPLAEPTNLAWVVETARSIFNFSDGVLPPLMLVVVNTFIWIRVAIMTEREVSFFGVGFSFRLGMLLSIVGGALLTTMGGYSSNVALLYFVLFFTFGLLAVAAARIDEKATGVSGTIGSALPYTRIAEIIAFIALILGSSALVRLLINPTFIRHTIGALDPLWSIVGWALTTVLMAIFLILGPLLERIILRLQELAANAEPVEMLSEGGMPMDFVTVDQVVREWTVLRYCLVIGAIVFALAIIWLFVLKPDQDKDSDDADDEEELLAETKGIVQPGRPRFDTLRTWLSMLRKHGISRGLLNAITVENMYANLGRIARERGYPRPPALPPDRYLPQLQAAFPHRNEQLRRITTAYMQVHYGDIPIEGDELRQLRNDYAKVMEPELPDEE